MNQAADLLRRLQTGPGLVGVWRDAIRLGMHGASDALRCGCREMQADDQRSRQSYHAVVTAALLLGACNPAPSDVRAEPATHVVATSAIVGKRLDQAIGGTLCEAGQTPFFSCSVGGKRVSVCRSGRGAVYRYGTSRTVELSSRKLSFASRSYSGGGENQLTAGNGDYTYTVYDPTVRSAFGSGGNEPAFSSGLVVARGGRPIWSRSCAGEASVDGDARRTLPTGRFVDH